MSINNRTQIQTALRNLYPQTESFPSELISLAAALVVRSEQLLPRLKPDEEIARIFICSLLASEQTEVTMNLPPPDTSKSPLAPRTFKKLTVTFRSVLYPNQLQATKAATRPRKRQAAAQSPASKKRAMSGHDDLLEIANSTDETLGLSPQKPALAPTPKKKIVRGGPKSDDPRKSKVIEICRVLGIGDAPTEAIIRAYKQYNNLVKDRWGLLCGIIVVIATKANLKLIENGTQGFYNRLIRISHYGMTMEKLEEWVGWSNRIISDQSWVKRVTNPRSKEANYKNKNKRYSSGIGNMVSFMARVPLTMLACTC